MNTDTLVQYVWMGNFNSEIKKRACCLGPISLASQSPTTPVYVWVPENLMKEAENLFEKYPSIEVRAVEKMLNGEYGPLKHISPQVDAIKKLLAEMEKTGSHTAQKDLISITVLAEFGGYYFDCTTRFSQKPNLPAIEDFKVTSSKDLDYELAATDIWAFAASKPGHELFTEALQKHLNFFTTHAWNSGFTGHVNGCISAVINESFEYPQREKRKSLAWEDVETESGHLLRELNLEKFNTGMWRRIDNELPSNSRDINYRAYEELGFFSISSNRVSKGIVDIVSAVPER